MAGTLGILRTLAAVVAVMGVGWMARKRGLFTRETTLGLARLLADVAFPALCFKGLAGLGGAALAAGWIVPVLGFTTLLVSALVGLGMARVSSPPASRPTFAFAVTMSNWIFFPLPIAQTLYGDAGVGVVLLHNAGAQVFIWTIGTWMLERGKGSGAMSLLKNPGLWATALGIVFAFAWPGVVKVPAFGEALEFVSSLTVPLAAVTIGAQLADSAQEEGTSGTGAVAMLSVSRLLVAPAAVIAPLWLLARAFPQMLPPVTFITEALIAAMPVSLTSGALVARARGDVRLSSRAILVTTLASVITVPVVHAIVSR